jgi:hypothetical protein
MHYASSMCEQAFLVVVVWLVRFHLSVYHDTIDVVLVVN